MKLEVDSVGDVRVVRVKEERLVYPVLGPFYSKVSGLVEEGARKVVIDLVAVRYIDSAAIGCLMDIHRLLEEKAGAMKLVGLQERVETMVSLTGLQNLVDVFSEEQSAIASFS